MLALTFVSISLVSVQQVRLIYRQAEIENSVKQCIWKDLINECVRLHYIKENTAAFIY
jgi:hypothetical protein